MVRKKQKVLIIKLSSLGDVIFNIPLANILHSNGYEVSWLVGEKGFDIINNNPSVDKIFLAKVEAWKKSKNIFANISEMFNLLIKIRKEHFDIVLDTQMRLKSLFWTLLSGAKRRIIAEDAKEFSIYGANEIIPSKYSVKNRHVVNRYLKYANYLGLCSENYSLTLPRISLEDTKYVDGLLENIDSTKPLVIISPKTTWVGKHWEQNNWKSLVEHLGKLYNIVFVGTKVDISYIEQISKKYLNLAGKTNLLQLIELLRRADLLISLDNGTTHLAWAVQRPKIVSVFCCTPSECYAPIGDKKKYKAVQSAICSPCHHKKCKLVEKYACTKSPTVESVLEQVFNIMHSEDKG